jgi:hypothetical protein
MRIINRENRGIIDLGVRGGKQCRRAALVGALQCLLRLHLPSYA